MSATTSPYQDYAAQQRRPTRHLVGLAMVLVFHAFLLYAISTGLARKFVKAIKPPVETKLIEEVKLPEPPAPPPPPAPPKTAPPPPPTYVPPVDVPQTSAPAPAAAISAVTSAPPPVAPPQAPATAPAQAPAPVVRVPAVLNAAVNCPRPEYPPASRRMEEEGTVQLRFLVEVDGRVVQTAIDKSSGFPRLDDAAKLALSKCQFKPGTVDGKPEQSWASMKYTWKLE